MTMGRRRQMVFRLRLTHIAGEAPRGKAALDLVDTGKDPSGQGEARSPLGLGRRVDEVAESIAQDDKTRFFLCLCSVVGWPVLRVGDFDDLSFWRSASMCAVRHGFPNHETLDGMHRCAGLWPQCTIGARTPWAILSLDKVMTMARLREHVPPIRLLDAMPTLGAL